MPDPDIELGEENRLPLHVVDREAKISVMAGRLNVMSPSGTKCLRLGEISMVGLHGGAGASIPCLQALAEAGVPVVLFSYSGHMVGQFVGTVTNVAATRRAQYSVAADSAGSIAIAKVLIAGKLRSTSRLARRRLAVGAALPQTLDRAAHKAIHCSDPAILRGIEGAAAAAWYGAWPQFIEHRDGLKAFEGRNRRPPRDPVNALLSYLYAVATGVSAAAASAAGLDQNVGFFHVERPGRPALALDLVEPIRPAVVDAAVLAAMNNGEFSAASFETREDGGVFLTSAGRRSALSVLERRLSTTFEYDGAVMTWRSAISHHAQLLARGLRAGRLEVPVPMPK